MKRPVQVAFLADGGPFGAPDLLALLPLQGVPLAQRRDLRRGRHDRRERRRRPAARARPMRLVDLAARRRAGRPRAATRSPTYQRALAALAGGRHRSRARSPGSPCSRPAAPRPARQPCAPTRSRRSPPPQLAPVTPTDTFADYCVYDSSIAMPGLPVGTPPYSSDGGAWAFDATGKPIVDHTETARVVFTIPRAPDAAAAAGRSSCSCAPAAAATVRSSIAARARRRRSRRRSRPARARRAPRARRVRRGRGRRPARRRAQPDRARDEEFLDVQRAQRGGAARQRPRVRGRARPVRARRRRRSRSTRRAAARGTVTFDAEHVALMGHSMGAWIAPLALAVRAAVRRGGPVGRGRELHRERDRQAEAARRPADRRVAARLPRPRLHAQRRTTRASRCIQWAAEPSDPQVYDAGVVRGAATTAPC